MMPLEKNNLLNSERITQTLWEKQFFMLIRKCNYFDVTHRSLFKTYIFQLETVTSDV